MAETVLTRKHELGRTLHRRVVVLVAVIVALVALPASVALAAPVTECDGTIGAVVVEGEVRVPDGKECVLNGTTVGDSIKVGKGSSLDANSIEVLKPGTVSIQAYLAKRLEVDGASKFVEGEPEEAQSDLLGGIQAVAGGDVSITDTKLGGGLQALNNSGRVDVTETFAEGAVELDKNKSVSVAGSFLGEGVAIGETQGDVTFSGTTSDESDLTIAKTKGKVTVEDNPSLGENFEVSETAGVVSVEGNTVNDNADISRNSGGAIVSGNKVGDSLSMAKIIGAPVEFSPCDPLDPVVCTPAEPAVKGTLIVVGNTVGDSVSVLEPGGDVTFSANKVEGSASVNKTKGKVTADGNTTGYVPPEPEPKPEPAPVVPELTPSGSLLVSEAYAGANVGDNTVAGNLGVTYNLVGTNVSDNQVRVGIAVSKNKGGTEVSVNRAGGDIECKDNDPAATGGGNVAGADGGSGSLKGECASL